MDNVETLPVRNQFRHQALELLANGFTKDFCEFISRDQRVIDVLHEAVHDFIDDAIPFTDEEAKLDLAFLLLDKTVFTAFDR